MIVSAKALQSGNAVRLTLDPADGADIVRVLRKSSMSFTGANDPAATLVYEGALDQVLDLTPENGALAWYKAYSLVGAAFVDSGEGPIGVLPAATYQDGSTDVRQLLIDRLDAGFRQEIQRGLLKIKPQVQAAAAAVAVLSAPPQHQTTEWPVVTVHLESERQAERGLGESLAIQDSEEEEGWLAGYNFAVTAWSQNPDERNSLHKSMRRILMANLPIFDAAGMVNIEFTVQDQDFISGEYPASVYASSLSFACKAPAYVYTPGAATVIDSVNVIATAQVAIISRVY